jgi:integrase
MPVKLANGKTRKSPRWYVEWRDHKGALRRWAGFSDKRATESHGRLLEKLVAYHRTGMAPDAELVHWLELLAGKQREQLVRLGLVALASGEPAALVGGLAPLVGEYVSHLRANECTPRHVQQASSRIRRCLEAIGTDVANLTAHAVEQYLAGLRSSPNGISYATSNHHLKSLKGFCNWLVYEGHLPANPLVRLKALPEQLDRRHDHAAFTPRELAKLLKATLNAKTVLHVKRDDRYWLYRFAAETGFRASEIRSLRVRDIDTKVRRASIRAAYSRKRKRTCSQPLGSRTARELAKYLKGRKPDEPAFVVPARTAELLRRDLKVARIPYQADDGAYRDFHALRHTFITEAGTHTQSFADLQALARHSTPALTARYAHPREASVENAVERMYDLHQRQG